MNKFQLSLMVFMLLIVMVGNLFTEDLWIYCSGLTLLYLTLLGVMSFIIRANFYVKAQHVTEKDAIALTFDDGPDEKYTPIVLDALKEKKAKAIFFLIGEKAAQHPELVKRIEAEGHQIGGHSYHHKWNFGFQVGKKIEHEIESGLKVLEEILERKVTLFRPPFGITNPAIARVCRKLNLNVIGWNHRTLDTQYQDAEKLAQDVIKKLAPGQIVLLHDNRKQTVGALPKILDEIVRRGIKTTVRLTND